MPARTIEDYLRELDAAKEAACAQVKNVPYVFVVEESPFSTRSWRVTPQFKTQGKSIEATVVPGSLTLPLHTFGQREDAYKRRTDITFTDGTYSEVKTINWLGKTYLPNNPQVRILYFKLSEDDKAIRMKNLEAYYQEA